MIKPKQQCNLTKKPPAGVCPYRSLVTDNYCDWDGACWYHYPEDKELTRMCAKITKEINKAFKQKPK